MGRPRMDHVAGEVEAARADLTLIEAAEANDSRAILVALKMRLARTIQDTQTPPRDLAALANRLMSTVKELEALDAAEAEDDIGSALTIEDEDFDPETI